MHQTSYSKTLKYSMPFDQVVNDIKTSLQDEGFGILSEINVQEVFEKKLEVNFSKYVILGTCNPPYAYDALIEEKEIGLLLPCNVIIYDDNNQTYISVIKPTSILPLSDNQEVHKIAHEIEEKLVRALQNSVKLKGK